MVVFVCFGSFVVQTFLTTKTTALGGHGNGYRLGDRDRILHAIIAPTRNSTLDAGSGTTSAC
jgi:hypothetical protein